MEKQNKWLLLLTYLSPVVVIFLLFQFNQNRLIYATTPSHTTSPASSYNSDNNQDKPLTLNERLTLRNSNIALVISSLSAIFALPSAIVSIVSLIKSLQSVDLLKKAKPSLLGAFDQLANQTNDEKEKQRLLEQKITFEKELNSLIERSGASKKARKWLLDNRQDLANQAVFHALSKDSVTPEAREKFYSEIKQYLYGIYECLDIGRTERLDKHYAEIQRNPALSSLYYKKALQFVKEEASRRLGGKEFAEMIPYFDTIISRFP